MIICNIKINKKLILKTSLGLMLIIALSICCIGIYKVYKEIIDKEENIINDSIPSSEVANILPENYTNILKAVHENPDAYIGQKISFTGYIYKIKNFSDEQFVLARDMDIGNNQTLIVGFLCSYPEIKKYSEYTWVSVTGEITKGYYNGETPILKIINIKEVQKPDNPNVSVPDTSYVPTAVIY